MSDPYYYVVDRVAALPRHSEYSDAKREAAKLARDHPGRTYTILGSIRDISAKGLQIEDCLANEA